MDSINNIMSQFKEAKSINICSIKISCEQIFGMWPVNLDPQVENSFTSIYEMMLNGAKWNDLESTSTNRNNLSGSKFGFCSAKLVQDFQLKFFLSLCYIFSFDVGL